MTARLLPAGLAKNPLGRTNVFGDVRKGDCVRPEDTKFSHRRRKSDTRNRRVLIIASGEVLLGLFRSEIFKELDRVLFVWRVRGHPAA